MVFRIWYSNRGTKFYNYIETLSPIMKNFPIYNWILIMMMSTFKILTKTECSEKSWILMKVAFIQKVNAD